MPTSILLTPMFFIMAGNNIEEDMNKSLILLSIGVVLFFVGIWECNTRENK